MRMLTLRAAAVSVFCSVLCIAAAAAAEDTDQRLLTRREGASLVRHALDYRASGRKPDCSHLVHEVLSTGGLDYPYATSAEIFDGIPQFRRVRAPQPGDVIVWRGHVGLVVDPDERTFYSSTRSGLTVDEYNNRYWRRRGTPRFYRYIVAAEADNTLRATANSELDDPIAIEAAPSKAAGASTEYSVPTSVHFATNGSIPSRREIQEAVFQLGNATASALDTPRNASLLLIRDFKVKKVRTDGDSGWAEIELRSAIELEPDGAWTKVKLPKQRWQLRRAENGWTVFVPLDRTYVAQSAAIPVLDRHVADESRTGQTGSVDSLVKLLRKENR
jgi:hypothetical protein